MNEHGSEHRPEHSDYDWPVLTGQVTPESMDSVPPKIIVCTLHQRFYCRECCFHEDKAIA